jgi:N-hydroxyarylamine O-acetyltransferase
MDDMRSGAGGETAAEPGPGTGAEIDVDGYLARIGAVRPGRADARALAELQRLQLRTVPFENLSVHLGESIVLAPGPLVDKVVRRRRGGFCYELNGAFAALLSALGYRVTLVEARVFAEGGGAGLPYDHMALFVVPVDGSGPWLADVGFGAFSELPLLLDSRGEQHDARGVFELRGAPDGDLDVLQDGEPQYRMSLRPRTLHDFVPTCWYHRTSPDSHFTRKLVCSRATEDGRITLSGRTLKRTATAGGAEPEVTELEDEAAVLDAYRRHFGIELEREPRCRPPGELVAALAQERSSQPS